MTQERQPRTLADVYRELGRVHDALPDNGTLHRAYITTDDGRPLVTVKDYLRELQLDLDRFIPRRERNGRFESRRST